jgi:hypothetical protein
MSADGNLKFALTPVSPLLGKKPVAPVPQERTCAVCELPLASQPPVLLKSGRSVHLDCYLRMWKRSASRGSN